ncbi:MAG: hypothetical protein KGH67_01110 [Candidatus Micrarchaeota archaeon]|nr:hypothetical protein [Candidatus Micrarchaeota archaeon]MDE1859106.1 hypothetical protein [Candidatus Micrarchaeota archaeon]
MGQKHVYDVRGKQSSILRLYYSDKEALIHAVFYRIAILFAIVTLIVLLYNLINGDMLATSSKRFVIILGILFIPQLFESFKAFSLIASEGVVFGHLNPSFLKYGIKKRKIYWLYKIIPYIVTLVWVIGLAVLSVLWFA